MQESLSPNSTKCVHYTFGNRTGECLTDYDSCAKQVDCPLANGLYCYVVWNKDSLSNSTRVIKAGCTRDFHENSIGDCETECVGNPHRKTRMYYCCCNKNLCNSNFKLPEPSAVNNLILEPTPNFLGNRSTEVSFYSILTPFLVVIILLCMFIYRFKTRTMTGRNETPNQSRASISILKRNRRLKSDATQTDTDEVQNTLTLSVIPPDERPSTSNHQFLDQNARAPERHLTLTMHPGGMGSTETNSVHLSPIQENICDQNLAPVLEETEPDQDPVIDLNTLTMLEVIGTGKFGTVHKAILPNSKRLVAIKFICPKERESWLNEKEVYQLERVRHTNISELLYSGQDPKTHNFWLVTAYAPRGCLTDHLRNYKINWTQLIRISIGLSEGLAHLHEFDVAHRDFKSKNVLLRDDMSPCITDFSVASILDTGLMSQLDSTKRYSQAGTPRYMAPEVLECSVTFTKASFTKIDVYALSLVLWELISRCQPLPKSNNPNHTEFGDYNLINSDQPKNVDFNTTEELEKISPTKSTENNNEDCNPYKLPYEEVVGENPDVDRMRRLVVVNKYRPPIRDEWRLYPASEYCRAIQDGWEYDADARISASCFVERFQTLPKLPPTK